MWTAQHTSDGEATRAGLGFFVDHDNGALRISHNGSQEKTRTRLVIYPERRHGVVVMSNSEWIAPDDFTTAVYEALE
jgi:hypothetical protein